MPVSGVPWTFLDSSNSGSHHFWATTFQIDACRRIFLVWWYCNGMLPIYFTVGQNFSQKSTVTLTALIIYQKHFFKLILKSISELPKA